LNSGQLQINCNCEVGENLTDSPKNNIFKEDLEVALQIFDHTNIKNQPIDYRNLVRILDGRIEKKRINQAIDRLTDSDVIAFGV
jgi:hypothetical protein